MADISTAADISSTANTTSQESAMGEIIQRALNVVKSNPEWITYIKNFNNPRGFVYCDDKVLNDITTAIDDENPIHSGASLALCLQKCRIILNNN